MIGNKFFLMLFDYRGTITRRQYWGSLLFLLILLSSSNLIYKWEALESLIGLRRYNSIQSSNIEVYLFLTYVFNAIVTILYFSSFAAALSVIAVTLKRSMTLGYSKLSAWFFSIVVYLSYFSLNGLSFYFQYKINDGYRNDSENFEMVIPIGLIVIGLIVALAIVTIILLSRQTEIDYEEDIDYYAYDSINCIYGLVKFSLVYSIIIICWKYALEWMIMESSFLTRILAIALIISYIYFYLNILVKRSRDAKVNSAYIISAFFLLMVAIGLYLFSVGMSVFEGKPVLYFFINKLCFILINIYVIGTYVLIALPSKPTEYIDQD